MTFQKGAFGSLHSGHPQSNFILNYQEVSIMFGYQNCSDILWEKNCSNDGEKLLKFEAEGREFANFLRSIEQFIQTVKGLNNSW